MAQFEIPICNLCFNVLNDSKCVAVEKVIKNVLNILLPRLELKDENKSVICNACFEKLLAAFEFKSTCIHTENDIMTYVEGKLIKPLDIKDIYMTVTEQLNNLSEDQKVCRLCMELIKTEFKSAQEIDEYLIVTCIPEVNLQITNDPLVCEKCFHALSVNTEFLTNCLNSRLESDVNEEPVQPTSGFPIKSEHVQVKIEVDEETAEDMFIRNEKVDIKSEENEFESPTSSLLSKIKVIKSSLTRENILKMKIYKCNECNYEGKFKHRLHRHQLKHKDISQVKLHRCKRCDFKTKYQKSLRAHQLTHADKSAKKITCPMCDYKTNRKSSLKSHLLVHRDETEVETYKCDECDFRTKYKHNIVKHREIGHKDVTEVKSFKCDVCDFQTKYKHSLKQHQKGHGDQSEMMTFKCQFCDFQTKLKYCLTRHLLKHPTESKSETPESDKLHPARIKDKPVGVIHKCGDCDYQTTNKTHLRDHLLRHKDLSEVILYKCSVCGFVTKHKRNLTRHHEMRHDAPRIEMYSCGQCVFETKNERKFKHHQAEHAATVIKLEKNGSELGSSD